MPNSNQDTLKHMYRAFKLHGLIQSIITLVGRDENIDADLHAVLEEGLLSPEEFRDLFQLALSEKSGVVWTVLERLYAKQAFSLYKDKKVLECVLMLHDNEPSLAKLTDEEITKRIHVLMRSELCAFSAQILFRLCLSIMFFGRMKETLKNVVEDLLEMCEVFQKTKDSFDAGYLQSIRDKLQGLSGGKEMMFFRSATAADPNEIPVPPNETPELPKEIPVSPIETPVRPDEIPSTPDENSNTLNTSPAKAWARF